MNNNQSLIDGLDRFAAFLKARPELPEVQSFGSASFMVYVAPRQFAETIRLIGTAEKQFDDDHMKLVRQFGPIAFQAFTSRDQVCTRVKVGEKVVPAAPEQVIPEKIIPAQPERVEDVWGWECPESILKAAPEDNPADDEQPSKEEWEAAQPEPAAHETSVPEPVGGLSTE